jgi:hypothetical protein
MSSAAMAPARQPVLACTTVRQFFRAAALALLAVAFGCAVYTAETCLFAPRRRFVESPTDVMMRALGLAHFCVGWLFLLTSPRLRDGRALRRLFAVALAGAGLCVAFALGGGRSNPLLLLAFYAYFLLHEVRDETTLYRAYGDAPADGPEVRRFLDLLSGAVCLLAVAALVAGFSAHGGALRKAARYTAAPLPWLLSAVALLAGAGAVLGVRALRAGRRLHGTLPALLAAHAPLLVVYAGLLAVLLLGGLLGSAGFNLIILLHVTAWLVFVRHRLRARPAAARGAWAWLRGTPSGFLALHLGVAAGILVLMAVRVHVWERAGWASQLLAASSFPYWSLMHISIAFWKGPEK